MRSPRTARIAFACLTLALIATAMLAPGRVAADADSRAAVISGPDGTLYLLYEGQKHRTTSATLAALGLDERGTEVVTQRTLEALPAAAALPAFPNGTFLAGADGRRYLVLNGLHAIPDDATFAAYGWAGRDGFPAVPVARVDDALLAALPQAAPIAPTAPAADEDRFDWGNCTWWVAHRRAVRWQGDAVEWYANAQAAGFAVGAIPVPGAILVRQSATWSGYGHVAYVEAVSGTAFTVSEMNVNGVGELSTRTYDMATDPPPGLLGFVYWRYGPPPPPPAPARGPLLPG
ncbi:MAG TPA: CHAP domain-containing protein [Thermomicrobiales bacterium]|nr:CHAP domain-containing protein [Thermomicrobiales bacterium]